MLPMKKRKSYYFTHPAQDASNSHSHFNQRERIPHREQEKGNKTVRKLKESKLVKLNKLD